MALRWNLLKKNVAVELATAVAAIATVGYFANTLADYSASRRQVTYAELEALRVRDYIKDLQSKVDERNARTEGLLSRLSQLAATPPPTSSRLAQQLILTKNEVADLKAQIADLHSTIDTLSRTIESSPEKALAIPLLTKDLNDFKATSQHDVESLRAEMLRGYELNKWLIGLMLAALLALVLKIAFESRRGPLSHRQAFE